MAILEIKKYPDPILKKKCEEVKEITQDIKKLTKDMIETMVEASGIGLAAPQVGELKRIIVVHLTSPQIFINPKIVKKSKETEMGEEGCLDFPKLFLRIKRARRIEIEALDIDGKIIKKKVDGLAAKVFQHEIDHLDGILFIDRLDFWQKLCQGLKIQLLSGSKKKNGLN